MREAKLYSIIEDFQSSTDFVGNEIQCRMLSEKPIPRSINNDEDVKILYLKGFFYEWDGCKTPEPEFKSMNNMWKAFMKGCLDASWKKIR